MAEIVLSRQVGINAEEARLILLALEDLIDKIERRNRVKDARDENEDTTPVEDLIEKLRKKVVGNEK